jgi:hypothetical protein
LQPVAKSTQLQTAVQFFPTRSGVVSVFFWLLQLNLQTLWKIVGDSVFSLLNEQKYTKKCEKRQQKFLILLMCPKCLKIKSTPGLFF